VESKEHQKALIDAVALQDLTDFSHPLTAGFTDHTIPGEMVFDLHYELELGFLISGNMLRIWPDFTNNLNPGDIWLTAMAEPHGYKIINQPCRVLVFLFTPELLSSFSLGQAMGIDWFSPFLCAASDRPMVEPWAKEFLFNKIKTLNQGEYNDLPDSPSLRILLMEMLIQLIGNWKPSTAINPQRDIHPLKPALDLVFHSKELVQAQQAAELCHMAVSSFNRNFIRTLGISFGRFALNHRLQQAAAQLVSTGKPIKSIALNSGFVDLSHFYKSFKDIYRETPKDYRSRNR
jgi:AraC-like DNA-binding protein